MIGDWVMVYPWDETPWKPKKITDINFHSWEGTDFCDSVGVEGWDELSLDQIKPIHLTEEILKKNGWEYDDEEAKFAPCTWSGGGLMLQDTDDGGYRIVVTSDYDDEDTNDTPFVLLYVHELQHALRLRRIEKEIEV